MIYINGRFLSQRITGIQRYAYEICCALQQIGVACTILAPTDIREEYDLTDLTVEVIDGKGSHWWEQVTLPRYMRRHHDGQLLLSLSGLNPLLYNRNILTIHDISYLLRPRSYSLAYCLYYRFMTPLVAKRAKKIITVSQCSKQEIVKYLHLQPDQIEVVYSAVRPRPLLPRDSNQKYLLAVGGPVPRKNIQRLLEAYCGMNHPDYQLYIAGGKHAVYANAEWSTYTHHAGVHVLGYVEEEEIIRLYRNATAYITPSLYEGFGTTNLEAMNQKCPVVAADIPAFHEVCGEAALFFDPLDIRDMQDKMNRIMQDDALRRQLANKGTEQLNLFSWIKSAERIKNIIGNL